MNFNSQRSINATKTSSGHQRVQFKLPEKSANTYRLKNSSSMAHKFLNPIDSPMMKHLKFNGILEKPKHQVKKSIVFESNNQVNTLTDDNEQTERNDRGETVNSDHGQKYSADLRPRMTQISSENNSRLSASFEDYTHLLSSKHSIDRQETPRKSNSRNLYKKAHILPIRKAKVCKVAKYQACQDTGENTLYIRAS